MAWTAPRTWTASEVVTAAMMNAHVRDNELVLKTGRGADGRVADISSATFASLSGANLTGVAMLGTANSYTAGRHRWTGSARFRLPVGADKYDDLGGGLRRGEWVEGDYLHHIASNQTTEYRYLGEVVSTPAGALSGSLWVEGDYLHYVSATGVERRCQSLGAASPHADAAAMGGSAWVETYTHWIAEGGTNEKPGHADVAHADGTSHSDTHSDVAHSDSHNDVGHSDSHGDAHSDTSDHGDFHQDNHADTCLDPPECIQHTDSHGDSHSDHADHADTHGDSHTDNAHQDGHGDSHSDSHSDHGDHGDAAHADQPTVV
jgi:hypothetical protein